MSPVTSTARSTTRATEHAYRIVDHRFILRCPEPLASHIDRYLAPFRTDRAPGASVARYTITHRPDAEPAYTVDIDGAVVQQADSAAGALDFVVWKVNEEAGARTDRFVAIHAGAVALDGAGIVIQGVSGAGKTTLVAGLVRSGCAYLTDETTLIDPDDGMVHPFPRALWMTPGSLDLMPELRASIPDGLPRQGRRKHLVRPEDLRPGAVGEPSAARVVVFPRYRSGATVTIAPMSRARALHRLAEGSFNLRRFGARGMRALGAVVAGASCYQVECGPLDEAVEAVRGLVARTDADGRASRGAG